MSPIVIVIFSLPPSKNFENVRESMSSENFREVSNRGCVWGYPCSLLELRLLNLSTLVGHSDEVSGR
jgi:hypothetical protein